RGGGCCRGGGCGGCPRRGRGRSRRDERHRQRRRQPPGDVDRFHGVPLSRHMSTPLCGTSVTLRPHTDKAPEQGCPHPPFRGLCAAATCAPVKGPPLRV